MPPHQGSESVLVPPANEPAEQFSIGLSVGWAHQAVELVQQLGMAFRHGGFLVARVKLLY